MRWLPKRSAATGTSTATRIGGTGINSGRPDPAVPRGPQRRLGGGYRSVAAEFDATRFRVKARVAAACPNLAKANRKLEVGTGGDTRSTKTATTAAGRSSSKA